MIRQRTKEALARKRAEGIVLGRPKGSKTRPELLKLHKRPDLIREMMRLGHSRRQIARVSQVHRNTLTRYIRNFIGPQA